MQCMLILYAYDANAIVLNPLNQEIIQTLYVHIMYYMLHWIPKLWTSYHKTQLTKNSTGKRENLDQGENSKL